MDSSESSPETLCRHSGLDLFAYLRTVEVEISVKPSLLNCFGSFLLISSFGRISFEARPPLKRSRRCLFPDDLEGQEPNIDKDGMNIALERVGALVMCHVPLPFAI